MISNNNSIRFDIILIISLLFFFELRLILGYSSNIYFFFIFLYLVYVFFSSFFTINLFSDLNNYMKQITFKLYTVLCVSKYNLFFLLKLFFYSILFKIKFSYYKNLLIKKSNFIFNIINLFFMNIKYSVL